MKIFKYTNCIFGCWSPVESAVCEGRHLARCHPALARSDLRLRGVKRRNTSASPAASLARSGNFQDINRLSQRLLVPGSRSGQIYLR